MGNEMGNNNTSGLREEVDLFQDKSQLEVAHADYLKGKIHVAAADIGKEDTNGDGQDDVKAEGKKSLLEVAQMDEGTGGNKQVSVSEDVYKIENETNLASIKLEGVAEEPHDYKDEKEEAKNLIPEVEEKSLHEVAYADKGKGEELLVPAGEDKNIRGIEKKLASSEQEETASTYDDNQKQDQNNAGDDNSTNIEAEEKSLQQTANTNTDETKAQSGLDPAAADPDGMPSPSADNQKQDEKATAAEEDNTLKDKSKGEFSQEATNTNEVETQDHLLPENETVPVLSDSEGATDLKVDIPEQDEKEEDNANTEHRRKPLGKDAHDDEIEDKNLEIAADEIVDCNNNPKKDQKEEENMDTDTQREKPLVKDAQADNIEEENLTIAAAEEEDMDAEPPQEKPLVKDAHADDVEEKILTTEAEDCFDKETKAELASGDIIVVDQSEQILEDQGKFELYPATEYTKVEAKPSESADEGMVIKPAASPEKLENHGMQQESNLDENPSGTSCHFEEQNSMVKEDAETRKSNSDAASDISHDSMPQEPVLVEPEQSEIAKLSGKEPLQVCNGSQEIDHMIKPYLASTSQENGVVLDSSLSTEMVQSVLPDLSLEVEKEMNNFSVKDTATIEVSSEEQFELKDDDETGNKSENATAIITDLLNGVRAKCNGEFPSEVNSAKTHSSESRVDGVFSDETQEVSETEDKCIVHQAILVREVSDNGASKNSHCLPQYGEESVEKSNGKGSEEGFLLNTSSDSNSSKDCQIEEAKIMENGHLNDASINPQIEATDQEQQKEPEKEAPFVTDAEVNSADSVLSVQKLKDEEESEEKKILEEMVEDLNPLGSDTTRRKSQEQSISHSYPTEQAEAVLSALHPFPENDQPDTHVESKKLNNSDSSMEELKQQTFGEICPTAASAFVNSLISPLDLSERPNTTPLTMTEIKPSVKRPSEQCAIDETPSIVDANYCQQESMGRFSSESNPDNMSIIRKSPSFDLDLRIDAREEESDQTPLLYQDKTTIESFSNQPDVTLARAENITNSLQHEPMATEEKVVRFEKSDSDKSKTPFLGFLKEEEEAEEEATHMLVTQNKQDNSPTAMKATAKVSVREITSVSQKGKEKRKPRTSLFGTCMCCAAVIN